MRNISDLSSQLKADEGYCNKPYKDTVGKETIGYGRNIQDKGITISEAEKMLADDIDEVRSKLATLIPWYLELDEVRRGVLENMAFEMGSIGLLGFKQTLALVRAGQYEMASQLMLQSLWAKQTPNRAARLSVQMEKGEWQ